MNNESDGTGNGGGVASGRWVDRHGLVNVGLEILAMGSTLAETGRLAAHAHADQLPAELVAIAGVADGIADTLTDLAATLRAEAQKLLHGR